MTTKEETIQDEKKRQTRQNKSRQDKTRQNEGGQDKTEETRKDSLD